MALDPKEPRNWPVGHYAINMAEAEHGGWWATFTVQAGDGLRYHHREIGRHEVWSEEDLEAEALEWARAMLALTHPAGDEPGAVRSPYTHKWPQPEEYKLTGLEADDQIAGYKAEAPRVTFLDLDALALHRTFVRHGALTICIVDLANGFTLVGESACADPANYDAEKGDHFAYEAALRKLWPLEGYLLRERLHLAEATSEGRGSLRHALEQARFHANAALDQGNPSDNEVSAICHRVDAITAALDALTEFERLVLGKAYDPQAEAAPSIPAEALEPGEEASGDQEGWPVGAYRLYRRADRWRVVVKCSDGVWLHEMAFDPADTDEAINLTAEQWAAHRLRLSGDPPTPMLAIGEEAT